MAARRTDVLDIREMVRRFKLAQSLESARPFFGIGARGSKIGCQGWDSGRSRAGGCDVGNA